MFGATLSTLAVATVLAGGAVIGSSAPGSTDAPQDTGVSQTHRQDGNAGNHDHPDMAQMHEQMMAEHPEMAQIHQKMMDEHSDMAQMHEQMMGGTGGGMMEGDSGMGM